MLCKDFSNYCWILFWYFSYINFVVPTEDAEKIVRCNLRWQHKFLHNTKSAVIVLVSSMFLKGGTFIYFKPDEWFYCEILSVRHLKRVHSEIRRAKVISIFYATNKWYYSCQTRFVSTLICGLDIFFIFVKN